MRRKGIKRRDCDGEKESNRVKEKERDEMFSFISAWSSDRITKK